MIKYFSIIVFGIVMSLQAFSQSSYKSAIDSATVEIRKQNYPEAINLYNAAKAFDPSMNNIVDDSINIVFNLILKQKDAIEQSLLLVKEQKKRADALKDLAEHNFELANKQKEIAQDALKISHANQIMYEAQGVVKLDPTLAMHLAAAALDSIHNIKSGSSSIDDSLLLVDKANRIYYENNFGETIINDQSTTVGKFTKAILWPDENSIWTITDKLFAVKWSNGNLSTKFKLDTAYQQYNFKILNKDSLIVFGIDRGTSTRSKSIKVWVITNKKTSFTAYTDSSDNRSFNAKRQDTISLRTMRDATDGWAKRVFDFEDKVYQFNNDGKLMLIDSVGKNIRNIAFSTDGELMAIVNADKALKILDVNGKLISVNANVGDFPDKIEFTPDAKLLITKQANSLQIFSVNNLSARAKAINFFPSKLQSYQISSDSRWLLVSTLSGNQQVIILYLYDGKSSEFKVYAQYKCLGSSQTSATFSADNRSILSSSDKIRLWHIPTMSSEPRIVETNSEFISSVQYNSNQYMQDSTLSCVTFNGNILNYKYAQDGTMQKIDSMSTIQQDGLRTTRLAAFLPYKRTLIVSEDGQLQLYASKDELQEFLNNFKFDKFTDDQKKRYGITTQ